MKLAEEIFMERSSLNRILSSEIETPLISGLTLRDFDATIDSLGEVSLHKLLRIRTAKDYLDEDEYLSPIASEYKRKLYNKLEEIWNQLYRELLSGSPTTFSPSLTEVRSGLSETEWQKAIRLFEMRPIFYVEITDKVECTIKIGGVSAPVYEYTVHISFIPNYI